MKRIKNEHIVTTVGHYLKRRQYTEPDIANKRSDHQAALSKLHLPQQQQQQHQRSLQEMTFQGAMNSESGVRDAICFSSVNKDVTVIDQQFTRLKTFVSEAVEPFKSELTHLLFPVFVHFFLELIINGQKVSAHKFRCRNQGLFSDVSEYQLTLESLIGIQSNQELSKCPNIKSFRENKYIIRLPKDVVDYLVRYLTRNDHLMLLQILNLHIQVEVQDADRNNLHLYEDLSNGDDSSNNIKPNEATKEVDSSKPESEVKSDAEVASVSNDLQMKSLESAIQSVRNEPPSSPSICLYTFTNTFQGLSSVSLSSDVSVIAGGFEDSAIRLWSLTPAPINVSGLTTITGGLSTFKLACDIDCRVSEQQTKPITEQVSELTSSSEMKTIRAHSGPVYGVCFVPDTRILLSCSEDTTVRACQIDNQSNLALYRGHNYPVWDVDCSPIGAYFATASQDRTAKLWYLDRTYPVRIFAGHTLDVDCVKFHPNANYVATGSSDKSVRLWNIQDGRMVRMFQGHRGTVFALAFSPNGQLLASAGEDRRIRIWDLVAGAMMKELRGHIDTVYSLCFSRDSLSLASGGLDGTIRLWDVRKGVPVGNQQDNHTSPELLGSFPAKSVGISLLHYSFHNLLISAGTRFS